MKAEDLSKKPAASKVANTSSKKRAATEGDEGSSKKAQRILGPEIKKVSIHLHLVASWDIPYTEYLGKAV